MVVGTSIEVSILLQILKPTAILIDNMYLQHASQVFGVPQLDPRKYAKAFLQPSEELYKTYIFDALPYTPQNATERQLELVEKKRGYFEAIQYYDRIVVELGDVRPKHTKCPHCNRDFYVPVQKLVDVKISVKLVSLAWSNIVKKIVLVAGDKDLLPAIKDAEPSGTIVRLAYVEEQNVQTSKDLIKACPEKQKLTSSDIASCKFEKP
jgi:uncharacterized LabA/DUF88 family protein